MVSSKAVAFLSLFHCFVNITVIIQLYRFTPFVCVLRVVLGLGPYIGDPVLFFFAVLRLCADRVRSARSSLSSFISQHHLNMSNPVTPQRGTGAGLGRANALSRSLSAQQRPRPGQNTDQVQPAAVHAVAIKLPPFWPHDPHIWFAQAEAMFNTRQIRTERTKFDHVVSALAPEFVQEIRDLVLRPPALNPYTTIKDQLIKRTEISEQARLRKLLSDEELGDRKPSQFLRKLQQLLGGTSLDNSFLRELFLQRLPASVRMVLASASSTMDLASLASMADRVMEVSSAPPPVAAVVVAEEHMDRLDALQLQVAALTAAVDKLSAPRARSRPSSPERYTARSRQASPARADSRKSHLCRYHAKFGDKALKCDHTCSYWPGNAQARH